MATGAPAYTVDDRSLLLPYYRRFFVDPVLPYLPRTLHPNTITHAGHALNLVGTAVLLSLWPSRGWAFAVAALTLQLYLWCDNADGAHARRTGQCSAFGEFLDHGLDMLNTTYIALLTTMSLGASPIWWVVIALLIPGAAAMTCWEQAQTGVFRLGMLNQVESLSVLAAALLTSAIAGTQTFEHLRIGPVTLRVAMLVWVTATLLFGMVRGVGRVVAKDGVSAAIPALGPIAFGAAAVAAWWLGAVSTIAAVAIVVAGDIYFGMRMLSSRLLSRKPRLDPPIVLGAIALSVLCAWRLLRRDASADAGPALAALACSVFGALAVLTARTGTQEIARAEPPPAAAIK